MEEDMDSLMNDPSMPSASLPEPESLEESGTPLFSDENNFDDTSSYSTNEEPSILEPVPDGEPPMVTEPVTFQLVERGTKRGKTSLVDCHGFTYNVHSRRPYATYWQCTMRPQGNPCKASVTVASWLERITASRMDIHKKVKEMSQELQDKKTGIDLDFMGRFLNQLVESLQLPLLV
ncbi:uncharacterized protein [Montipora foliosa]